MGAVTDRLTLTLSEVKDYVGVSDSSEDDFLNTLITAVKQAADLYLNNPFLDSAGVAADIPDLVKLGCFVWISREFQRRTPGVTMARAGELAEKYASEEEIGHDVRRHWQPYRKHPVIGGTGA
tara:strand:- start:675 stop:1043 length:369 start_codon:yes stop_codon:yes gene_type:complete